MLAVKMQKSLQHTYFNRLYTDFTCWENHNDVIKWKHFPRYWPFVRGIQRWLVNSPHKANDAELWCFLGSGFEQMVDSTIETLVIIYLYSYYLPLLKLSLSSLFCLIQYYISNFDTWNEDLYFRAIIQELVIYALLVFNLPFHGPSPMVNNPSRT